MTPAKRHSVLVLVNNLSLGGTQINAVDLAAAVKRHGYDSFLAGPRDTLTDGPSLFDIARERGVDLEAYDRPMTTRSGARDLTRMAASRGADLIHVYGSWNWRNAYWGPSRFARRPLVITVYEMAVSREVPLSPPLIVGTGYLVDDLRDRVGHTRLISPPVDLERDNASVVDTSEFLSSLGLAGSSAKRIVTVTRLDEEMKSLSVETAISAITRTRAKDLVLIIVGGGDAEVRLRALGEAANRALGRRAVVFAGPMSDPRPAYASAHVALGMGGSAARALAFGRPLIVQGENGWSRIFDPETSAALFRNSFWSPDASPTPADDLARDIDALVVDDGWRERLSEFGVRFSAEHFGLEGMAERLASVYDHALSEYRVTDWSRDLGTELSLARARVLSRSSPSRRPNRAPEPRVMQ
jgi:glycosyltransferase involved in cell wall biosynthesis